MFSENTLVAIKKAKELLYTDRVVIISHGTTIIGGRIAKTTSKTSDSIKCRLSYRKITNAYPGDDIPTIQQEIVLFMDPSIKIENSMEFIVTKNKEKINLVMSGNVAHYSTHQEIPVRLKEVRYNG